MVKSRGICFSEMRRDASAYMCIDGNEPVERVSRYDRKEGGYCRRG